jgi:hypothetical protein
MRALEISSPLHEGMLPTEWRASLTRQGRDYEGEGCECGRAQAHPGMHESADYPGLENVWQWWATECGLKDNFSPSRTPRWLAGSGSCLTGCDKNPLVILDGDLSFFAAAV